MKPYLRKQSAQSNIIVANLIIKPHLTLIFQHENTFFLCYITENLTILQLYNTCRHAYKPLWASWNVNSPVTEVKEILEVVTAVVLSCDDVTDEAVVDLVVWLVVVGWVVDVTDKVVLVGWLVLVRWVVLVDEPEKFSFVISHAKNTWKCNKLYTHGTRQHLSCPNRTAGQQWKCYCMDIQVCTDSSLTPFLWKDLASDFWGSRSGMV